MSNSEAKGENNVSDALEGHKDQLRQFEDIWQFFGRRPTVLS